mgnify:CR=1 FL=1
MDLLVGLGNGVPHADHPVAQPQPCLLCGVYCTGGSVHLGKATTSAPSENIFTPKGVPHTVTVGRCITVARMVLTGSQPPSASVV